MRRRSASYAWRRRERVGKLCVDKARRSQPGGGQASPGRQVMRGQHAGAEGALVARASWNAGTVPNPRPMELALLRAASELWESDDQEIGYLARLFTQTSLPYRDPGEVAAWGRRNGNLVLVVQPGMTIDKEGIPRSIGYPYGTVPRLLLTWLSTEAVRTRSPQLTLGASMAEFMRAVGLTPTGGRYGTIARLRKQMERLFQATLSVRWEGDAQRESGGRLNVAASYDLWWADRRPDQPVLLPSTVRLSAEFYEEVTRHPVPLDVGALRALMTLR